MPSSSFIFIAIRKRIDFVQFVFFSLTNYADVWIVFLFSLFGCVFLVAVVWIAGVVLNASAVVGLVVVIISFDIFRVDRKTEITYFP